MNCPFCAVERESLVAIVMHVRNVHPEQMGRARLVVDETVPLIRLPVVSGELDMDAIYLRRPDLIKPRGVL